MTNFFDHKKAGLLCVTELRKLTHIGLSVFSKLPAKLGLHSRLHVQLSLEGLGVCLLRIQILCLFHSTEFSVIWHFSVLQGPRKGNTLFVLFGKPLHNIFFLFQVLPHGLGSFSAKSYHWDGISLSLLYLILLDSARMSLDLFHCYYFPALSYLSYL